jgi:hypothetical protein
VTTCSSAQGGEDVDVEQDQLLVRDLVGVLDARKRPVQPLVRERSRHVDALRVVERSPGVGDRDHRRALFVQQLREMRADVAEALHGDGHAVEPAVALRNGVADAVQAAARRRFLPAERAADRQRLAGHDAEHRVALVHRVRVEDPRHDRAVRADVGRGNVLLRADLVDDLARVAPRHPLELAAREPLRIDDDAALRAAERDAHQCAFPRHPHRERLDLVERDVRVVADAALRRAARDVVRDAVALEDLRRPVVHADRNGDLDRFLARAEHAHEVVVDTEGRRDPSQLRLRDLERVLAQMRDRCVDRRHRMASIRSLTGG